MRQSAKNFKRLVVKVGSSLFYSRKGELDLTHLAQISRQVSQYIHQGGEVVLVSSGAIALGMEILGLKTRPKELTYLQAAAAIGQNALMAEYSQVFKQGRLNCSQVLLTWEDFESRQRYLNAKNTLLTLLRLKSVPIVNENDTISTAEIKFGDNDRLSALVATLVNTDLLVILSDVDGLLDKDKKVIPVVEKITAGIHALACPTDKKTCVGGMTSKIEAAKICLDAGIPCLIANGRKKDILLSAIAQPQKSGTLFVNEKSALSAKERWLAFGTKTKGRIIVDSGAKKALLNNKSLLCVGIVALEGEFESRDIVSICDRGKQEFARGKTTVSSSQLEEIKGLRFEREIIHRDNIVIL